MSIRTKRHSTRSFAAVIAAALIASVLALVAAPVAAKTPIQGTSSTSSDQRVEGADRYATATAAASSYLTRRTTLGTWNTIVVVSGDNYPDALSAASLAGALAAPIILMPSDGTLPLVLKEWALTKRDQVQANSTTTSAFKLHAVGGTSALPDAGIKLLMAELNKGDKDGGLVTMTRTSGATRAATAAAVANTKNAAGANIILSGTKEIFIANEASFADAMSIAPYLFNAAAPIVLTPAGSLGADAKAVLKTYKTLTGTEITIIGGKAAVSDQVITDLVTAGHLMSSITRVSGADRYSTSVAVAKWMDSAAADNRGNFNFKGVVLVNGENFPDGLAAAPYAGHGTGETAGEAGRMVLLTTAAAIAPAVATQMTTLAKTLLPENLYVIGGTSAVSAAAVTGSNTASAGQDTTSTLTCVESTGGTGVTLKIPGNITGGTVSGKTSLGDEDALILNGSLTINGSSNVKNPTVAMASGSYSAVTGVTTLTGDVTAGVLAKGTVITWSGLTELANTAVRRKITGATCTIADDKTGIAGVTIQANVGSNSIDVTFAEKVVGFGCGDVVATIAAQPASVPLGCVVTGPNTAGTSYRLDYFTDYNGNGKADPAWSGTISAVSSGVFTVGATIATANLSDKVTLSAPAGTDCTATMYVFSAPSTTTIATTNAWGGHSGTAMPAIDDCTNTGGTISSAGESDNLAIAAADSFVFDGRLKFASVAIASTAPISVLHAPGCTITTGAVHGLVVGDIVDIAGLTTAADNGTFEVDTRTSTTVFTVRMLAACNGAAGSAGTTSEAGGIVYDVSNNAGTSATTKTVNSITDADVTKPVLTASFLCTQAATIPTIGNGTSVVASASQVYGPKGVAANAWKLNIVNSRGMMIPKVVVDDTAKSVTITGDLAYSSIEDVQASATNDGILSWSFSRSSGTGVIGTTSATTVALKTNGGGTGDVPGTQTCSISVTSNERLQTTLRTANTVTGAVAVNGVATTLDSAGAFGVVNANLTKFTSTGTIAPTSTVVAGTVTVTLTDSGALLKDMKGNQVTVLAITG